MFASKEALLTGTPLTTSHRNWLKVANTPTYNVAVWLKVPASDKHIYLLDSTIDRRGWQTHLLTLLQYGVEVTDKHTSLQ